MSSTVLPSRPPESSTGPPTGCGSVGFAALLASVDGTDRADGPAALVTAVVAAQRLINHVNGRMVELVGELHGTFRDQILQEVLDEDELARLATPAGGLDLSRADLGDILDLETTVDSLNDAHTTAIRMASLELAAALGWSRRQAAALVRQHLAWQSRTPTVVDAMTSGELEADKAAVIGAATRVLTDRFADDFADQPSRDQVSVTGSAAVPDPAVVSDSGAVSGATAVSDPATVSGSTAVSGSAAPASVSDEIAARVIARAAGLSRRQVALLADAMVLEKDPDAAEKRHRREVRDRRLELDPGFECTASVKVVGAPADVAVAAYNRMDVLARRVKATGDGRSLDQLRCDLTLAVMTGTAKFEQVDPDAPSDSAGSPASAGSAAASGGAGVPVVRRSTSGDAEGGFGATRPMSVGCECVPGGQCICECGTAYADPAERAPLPVLEHIPVPERIPVPALRAAREPIATPGQVAGPERADPMAGSSALGREVFPVVPVAPGEVPGRAAGVPETILTIPLQTVLGWATEDPSTTHPANPADLTSVVTASDAIVASRSDVAAPAAAAATAAAAVTGAATATAGAPTVTRAATVTGAAVAAADSVAGGSVAGAGAPAVTVSADRSGQSRIDRADVRVESPRPGWLERVGPVVDSVARRVVTARLAEAQRSGSGEFRIAVTDRQGRVVQYHAVHARTLRGLLREAVAVDYGTCVFPTCTTSALRCQADHARQYAVVRETRTGNMEPLCGVDHSVKTAGGYQVVRTNPHDPASPATWQLVMRSGHRYPLTVNGTQCPTGTAAAEFGNTVESGTSVEFGTSAGPGTTIAFGTTVGFGTTVARRSAPMQTDDPPPF